MSKVLKHPNKEEIISKLLAGDSVKEIEGWLKKKYPRTRRLHVSYMTLQKFRSGHLEIKGEILEEIKNRRSEVDRDATDAEARLIIENSSAYQEKITEIVSAELDVTRRLLEMDKLINSRIEYYYNILSNGGGFRDDKIFLEYINAMKGIMQDWKKYIEGVADTKIEHNINVSVINDHATILKDSVLDVLSEISPELIPVFIEKVGERTRKMKMISDDDSDIRIIDVT
jgi:hypothetical protein